MNWNTLSFYERMALNSPENLDIYLLLQGNPIQKIVELLPRIQFSISKYITDLKEKIQKEQTVTIYENDNPIVLNFSNFKSIVPELEILI